MARKAIVPILLDTSMLAIKNTGNGGRIAEATPFGNFMESMPFLVPFSALEIEVFIAMITIIIEIINAQTGHILDEIMIMALVEDIQSGRIPAFLSVAWQNRGPPNPVFPIESVNVLAAAGRLLEEEEGDLENNVFRLFFYRRVIHEYR
jgi:hypothetical protein